MKMKRKHMTIVYGLCDIYEIIASTQHGVSTVNQLPWEYNEKVEALKEVLRDIIRVN